MKYTKIFETEGDYESFRRGDDWFRPNICTFKNSVNIKYNGNLFPVKLITGDNGILGIEVYNYLIENNIHGSFLNKIYVDGLHVPAVQEDSNTSLVLTDGGECYYKLDNNGFITTIPFI
jgi:hypothetical protein